MTNQLPFSLNQRDKLYYDRWEYCLGFHLYHVNVLRELDHDFITRMIEARREWQSMVLKKWGHGYPQFPSSRFRTKEITDEMIENLHHFCDFLLGTQHKYKLVLSNTQAWVYTNDLALVSDIVELPYITQKTYSQAVVTRPKNTIRLKTANHQFRSYIRYVKLTETEKEQLGNFFLNQQESIRVSPAFNRWFTQKYTRTQDYFFIDYNNDSSLLLLSLIKPGLIRKTMQIVAD